MQTSDEQVIGGDDFSNVQSLERYSQSIVDEIPIFTEETPESLDAKIPGWLAYLRGETFTPNLPEERPKRRGRPQIHHLPPTPTGVHVNKLSDAVPICNRLGKPAASRLIREYQAMAGSPEQRVKYIATAHKLPYNVVRQALERVI